MNEIEKKKTNEIIVPSKEGNKSLSTDLIQLNAPASLTINIIMFFVMMIIPAHIAVAMLFATGMAVCWQLRLILNSTNKRIEHLEGLLSLTTQDKTQIENDRKKLIE